MSVDEFINLLKVISFEDSNWFTSAKADESLNKARQQEVGLHVITPGIKLTV